MRQELSRAFPDADNETISAAIARSGGYLGQALALAEGNSDLMPETQSFAQAFLGRNALELTMTLVPMEKYERAKVIQILEQWSSVLQQALLSRSGGKAILPLAEELGTARDPKDILQALRNVKKCIEYAEGNVSCAAICGYLAWALR